MTLWMGHLDGVVVTNGGMASVNAMFFAMFSGISSTAFCEKVPQLAAVLRSLLRESMASMIWLATLPGRLSDAPWAPFWACSTNWVNSTAVGGIWINSTC